MTQNEIFNAAINFAIGQGSEASEFLRAWREGDTSEWPDFEFVTVAAPSARAVYIRLDQYQKACFAPYMCEVGPEPRKDRIPLYAIPVAAPSTSPKPVFWYRPVGNDGGYEGPIHHNQIEAIRVQSGAWKPLFALAPTTRYLTDELIDILADANTSNALNGGLNYNKFARAVESVIKRGE